MDGLTGSRSPHPDPGCAAPQRPIAVIISGWLGGVEDGDEQSRQDHALQRGGGGRHRPRGRTVEPTLGRRTRGDRGQSPAGGCGNDPNHWEEHEALVQLLERRARRRRGDPIDYKALIREARRQEEAAREAEWPAWKIQTSRGEITLGAIDPHLDLDAIRAWRAALQLRCERGTPLSATDEPIVGLVKLQKGRTAVDADAILQAVEIEAPADALLRVLDDAREHLKRLRETVRDAATAEWVAWRDKTGGDHRAARHGAQVVQQRYAKQLRAAEREIDEVRRAWDACRFASPELTSWSPAASRAKPEIAASANERQAKSRKQIKTVVRARLGNVCRCRETKGLELHHRHGPGCEACYGTTDPQVTATRQAKKDSMTKWRLAYKLGAKLVLEHFELLCSRCHHAYHQTEKAVARKVMATG